jgi:hypothetical protein
MSRISQHVRVKSLMSREKGLSECIAHTLTSITIVLSQVEISKSPSNQIIKLYTLSKYNIAQNRPIIKLLVHFFVFITFVYKIHIDHYKTNSSNLCVFLFK